MMNITSIKSYLIRCRLSIPKCISQYFARTSLGINQFQLYSRLSYSTERCGLPICLRILLPHHYIETLVALITGKEYTVILTDKHLELYLPACFHYDSWFFQGKNSSLDSHNVCIRNEYDMTMTTAVKFYSFFLSGRLEPFPFHISFQSSFF